MSDKKKSGSSIFPFFVDGEQPSANKFNSISIQTRSNLYVLEKTIGDIWAESEPYVTSTNKKLSSPISKKTSFELNPGSDEKGYSLNIPSIGRLLGPISKLNPFNLTEGLSNGRVNVDLERDIAEEITENVYSYSLNYPGTVILSITGSGSPSNPVASPTLLSASGDYFYDTSRSVLYFYDKSGPDWIVEYTTIPSEYNGGSSYTGSSANLIPDESYMNAQGVGVSVTLNGDYYSVVIPSIAHQNLTSNEGVVLESNEINYGAQLKLPNVLRALYGADFFDNNSSIIGEHLIPEGFLYLKNFSTGEIYTEGEYYYVSDTEIKIIGIEIENPSTDIFCITTIGTDITSSIQDLKLKQFHHSHSREFGEPLVPISSIGSITDKEGNSGPFTKSENDSNFAPQYLHRDGYDSAVDAGLNDHNAMRGNLLIGKLGGSAGSYVGTGSSYKLLFGNEDTSLRRGGNNTFFIQNDGNIQIESYDLTSKGDNFQRSSNSKSDVTFQRYTDYTFKCEPNEYRSSSTQRPGKFEFIGGPVYLNGLDSYVEDLSQGSSSSVKMRQANNRADAIASHSSDWFCPGIGMATIYFDNVTFSEFPNSGTSFWNQFNNIGVTTTSFNPPPGAMYFDIGLPTIGDAYEDQFVSDTGTTSASTKKLKITASQVISMSGMIKPKSYSNYSPISALNHNDNITLVHSQQMDFYFYELDHPVFFLHVDQNKDHEGIRVLVPRITRRCWIDNNGLRRESEDVQFDLRINIFYMTHRV